MNTEERQHIEVVAAIIYDGNRIFATQRGYCLLYTSDAVDD